MLFETVKQIVRDHHGAYQPVSISGPSDEEIGPISRTTEEADRWIAPDVDERKSRRSGRGVDEATLAGAIAG